MVKVAEPPKPEKETSLEEGFGGLHVNGNGTSDKDAAADEGWGGFGDAPAQEAAPAEEVGWGSFGD